MPLNFAKLEQSFFRQLNAIVEPAVRKGIGSPVITPAGLIVLETVGFKSGQQRSTPLLSFGVGRYRIVSTARGTRSFWVKNLSKDPRVSYYLGGRRCESNAIVISSENAEDQSGELHPLLRTLVEALHQFTRQGWAFAILVPAK